MFQNSRTLDILLERFQCTHLDPKLIFWVFSHHFGAPQRPFGFAPHTLRSTRKEDERVILKFYPLRFSDSEPWDPIFIGLSCAEALDKEGEEEAP